MSAMTAPAPFAAQMRALGENLFAAPNVKGWPGGTTWINSSTLLARKQFVEQLFRATEAAPMRTRQSGQRGARGEWRGARHAGESADATRDGHNEKRSRWRTL